MRLSVRSGRRRDRQRHISRREGHGGARAWLLRFAASAEKTPRSAPWFGPGGFQLTGTGEDHQHGAASAMERACSITKTRSSSTDFMAPTQQMPRRRGSGRLLSHRPSSGQSEALDRNAPQGDWIYSVCHRHHLMGRSSGRPLEARAPFFLAIRESPLRRRAFLVRAARRPVRCPPVW